MARGIVGGWVEKSDCTYVCRTDSDASGTRLELDAAAVVEASGDKVLGAGRPPLRTRDFSSFRLQAQASGAKVIGLANAGGDTINSIKQAAEFGIVAAGQRLAGLLIFSTDVASLGLATAQGLALPTAFAVAPNDAHKKFSARYNAPEGRNPTMDTHGAYPEG